MIISLIKNGEISNFVLPTKIFGNEWITDYKDGVLRNLINIEAENGKWIVKSNFETKLISNEVVYEKGLLTEYAFYYLRVAGEKNYMLLYAAPLKDASYKRIAIKGDGEFSVGRADANQIIYKSEFINNQHAVIKYQDNTWSLKNLDTNFGTYVNGKVVMDSQNLNIGDVLFLMGLKVIIMKDFILVNNPNNNMRLNSELFTDKNIIMPQLTEATEEEENIELYNEDNYFLRAPRFKSTIETAKLVIDPPPNKENQPPMPIIYTVGPMLTMGMTSMVTGVIAVNGVMNGTQTWGSAAPSIIISGAMLMTMILWPLLSKGYEKRQRIQKERTRQTKYRKYLDKKREVISTTMKIQQQILTENNVSLEECRNIIQSKKRNLWEREKDQSDFLTVRLGSGALALDMDISYPEERFTVDDDDLMSMVYDLVNESKDMPNVPISMSLVEKNISAIVGDRLLTKEFIDSLILQLTTFHSYEDLKIVFLTSKSNVVQWEYLKFMPHTWNNERNIRFFASEVDEMKRISGYLENEFNNRMYNEETGEMNSNRDYKSYNPYYLIIVDNLKVARNLGIVNSVLGQTNNKGFSLLIRNDNLSNLPNECTTFISIGGKDGANSGFFENELVANKQKTFVAELNRDIDMKQVAKHLFNIPIKMTQGKGELPKTVSFLEMYNVGKVEQLNPLHRWESNNPINSLQVPVGIDESGELFKLDLHEKFHGPHGLIAGMTGSGKSEFIITYILSLATNFHPNEVSFVLIDYKGGGLAGAFENKETGVKLPHLAGTITNLDTVEMKRSLASIQSELRRRQAMFNRAREILSESTIDIYKYQRLYREGLVKEPMSHLFIISDEFAELKVQQPEFMEQLISTARIGRSLGVHLILATQKPSGVVDDQIWSNSKFRVCLKVQDKSDSMDMIKSADAAALKDVGRFYLQVGYNEFFALGQSAWCGAQYIPTEKLKKKRDNSINFIDTTGYVIKNIDTEEKIGIAESKGEELQNIVKYLSDIAQTENIQIDQLWLERIPEEILINDLKSKYLYESQPYVINPIIGEYDNPDYQKQGLLTLPLSSEGNAIIYGAAGSGNELMLNTLVYSTMMEHTPDEVNFYLLDFGAETLRAFKQAPHVGDVLVSGDIEKIRNLFKVLASQIFQRKKLFADFNGDYQTYCKTSGKTLPTMVVVINNYEAFNELYEEFDDQVVQITREGIKYGIIFVITVNGPNGIRYRLLQNFKLQLVLQMNDPSDYSSILGNINNTYPSKIYGRGLVRMDDVYEFQTAYAYKRDKLSDYIKVVSGKLKSTTHNEALSIPVLPEIVDFNLLKNQISTLNKVPIGILKHELEYELVDFKTRYTTLISSQDVGLIQNFVVPLINVLQQIKDHHLIVIDAENIFNNAPAGVKYYNGSFDALFKELNNYTLKQEAIYKANGFNRNALNNYAQLTVVLIGITKFRAQLNDENNNLFAEFMMRSKDYGKNNFILVETIDHLRNMEYDEWYKAVVNPSYGIWLGNGITEQFIIKLAKTPRNLSDEIPNNFGYSIVRGNPKLIKFLEGGFHE